VLLLLPPLLPPLLLLSLGGARQLCMAVLPHSDVRRQDANGMTALMHAVNNDSIKVCDCCRLTRRAQTRQGQP
jgi:hypothetical protein